MADGGRRNKTDVSLVLPCRDEEATVAECVLAAAGFLASAGLRGEILVVDNGSAILPPCLPRLPGQG